MELKDFYYFFEDRYYEFLDKINEKIPVYRIIDPIDRVFPSFVLVLIFVFLLFFFILLLLFGNQGGPLEPISKAIWSLIASLFSFWSGDNSAKIVVMDNSENPIQNAEIIVEVGSAKESMTTNSFGEAKIKLFGDKAKVSVKASGFKPFEEEIKIEPRKLYKITLEKSVSSKLKQIVYELRDEKGLISSNTSVSISFSCSDSKYVPANINSKGAIHRVSVQSACGTLVALVRASGFEETRKTIDLAITEGTVIVNLRKEILLANVRVLVKDHDTSQPISGVYLTFLKGEVIAFQGGTTDNSGSKIVENVSAGTYVIEARPPSGSTYGIAYSDEFTIADAQFSSNQPYTVEIRMKKTDSAKKILIKFVDSSNDNPISNVFAQLIANNRQSVSLRSNNDGIVNFQNLSLEEKAYLVIASHPNYVLKVINNLKFANNNQPTIVKLDKVTSNNSGKAKVIVSEYGGNKVQNASVFLYSSAFSFPIADGLTDKDGLIEFINLPPGNYKAKALKEINGKEHSNFSGEKSLSKGSEIQLEIVLVISNGFIEVKVVDESNRPVQGASVSFVENNREIGRETTNAQGRTQKKEFSADKSPMIVVSKQGYYTTRHPSVRILPNATQSIEIVLKAIPENQQFKPAEILLDKVLDTSGREVSRLEDNKNYVFKFNLIVDRAEKSDVKAVIRTSLENQLNANNSTMVIKRIDSPNLNVIYSSCFNPQNNYEDCSPTDNDAKQAILSLNSADDGVYIVFANVFIKEVEDTQENNTKVELRYGIKTKKGDNEEYKPNRNSLYLWTTFLNSSFCTSNCGFLISAKIKSSQNGHIREWRDALEGTIELRENEQYDIAIEVLNSTKKIFENLQMSFTIEPTINPNPIQITPNSGSIGRLSPNQTATLNLTLTALKPVNSIKLKMSLNVEERGKEAEMLFSISALNQLFLTLDKDTIKPQPNEIVIATTKDNANRALQGALIEVFEKEGESKTKLNIGGQTNSQGQFTIIFPQSYAVSTTFEVVASKDNYVSATKELRVTQQEVLLPTQPSLECIKVDEQSPSNTEIELNSRNCNGTSCNATPVNITIKNDNCGSEVEIKLSKAAESDISISKTNFTLSNNATEVVSITQGKQLGVHPIFLNAKKDQREFYLGFVLAIATTNNSCLSLERVVNNTNTKRVLLDFSESKEIVKVINKCYTGFSDNENPKVDLGSNNLNQSLYFTLTNETKNPQNFYSEQTYDIRPIRVSNNFFLVSVNDFKK
ncbi:MAG: hypothetical protein QXS90_00445 [Candidatus Diapherotrites archaeon]